MEKKAEEEKSKSLRYVKKRKFSVNLSTFENKSDATSRTNDKCFSLIYKCNNVAHLHTCHLIRALVMR